MSTLTGWLHAGTDVDSLAPGDRVTVLLDGWTGERLTLGLTEVRPHVTRHPGTAWLYGVDPANRLRLVLVRTGARNSSARLPAGRPGTPGAADRSLSPHQPSLWKGAHHDNRIAA